MSEHSIHRIGLVPYPKIVRYERLLLSLGTGNVLSEYTE